MLTQLRVQDFLLIESAQLAFAPGLNVLTGETGAGKSLLLQALALLLGRRGALDWIRPGAGELCVDGTFRASPRALRLARRHGIPLEGEELIVRRELRAGGRGRCFVNGQRVLVATLRALSTHLVDIHGQRQEERFRRAEAQRDLLDLYGDHAPLLRAVRQAHRSWAAAAQARQAAAAQLDRLAREEDWIRYQLDEIERLGPAPDELESLRERLAAQRRRATEGELAALAEQLLNGREGAVLESLEELDHRLGPLREAPAWREFAAGVATLRSEARALYRRLQELQRALETEPDSLAEQEARLAALEDLERKHHRSLETILELAEGWRRDLELLAEGEAALAQRSADVAAADRELAAAAGRLTQSRKRAAQELARALADEMAGLAMPHCRFRIELDPLTLPSGGSSGPRGAERVRFTVETNPGTGFRPLGEIASGGEMARIALALRVILGRRGEPRLAVFDEIDAGLGGGAARSVAERLVRVALHRQVLLVTHLAPIAAHGARHFRLAKRNCDGETRVEVAEVRAGERIAEVARMLSGEPEGRQARDHARRLLEQGNPLPRRKGSGTDFQQ